MSAPNAGPTQAACHELSMRVIAEGLTEHGLTVRDAGCEDSPAGTARIVARMLGTDYTSPQRYAHLHRGPPRPARWAAT